MNNVVKAISAKDSKSSLVSEPNLENVNYDKKTLPSIHEENS